MTVQYAKNHKTSKALLVEYHPSVDLVSVIPCTNELQAKNIAWKYSVGVWKIKNNKKNR